MTPVFDAALRRKLRKQLGSRVQRRCGLNGNPKLEKPRQKLARLIDQWASRVRKEEP
jgi:hypothetical protein